MKIATSHRDGCAFFLLHSAAVFNCRTKFETLRNIMADRNWIFHSKSTDFVDPKHNRRLLAPDGDAVTIITPVLVPLKIFRTWSRNGFFFSSENRFPRRTLFEAILKPYKANVSIMFRVEFVKDSDAIRVLCNVLVRTFLREVILYKEMNGIFIKLKLQKIIQDKMLRPWSLVIYLNILY